MPALSKIISRVIIEWGIIYSFSVDYSQNYPVSKIIGLLTLSVSSLEPCTLSTDEMERNNVLLQGFYENRVYFYHGDYVGFYCKQNHFGAESGTTLFQVQCKRGQLTYPRCVERGE